MPDESKDVHEPDPTRSRGVRMSEELWDWVEHQAGGTDEQNASSLIEKWVAEKKAAVGEIL